MKVERTNDRDYTITFRQSWLNTFLSMCPEQARAKAFDDIPDVTTDAAACGTGVHAGIEAVLKGHTRTEGFDVMVATLEALEPTLRWTKMSPNSYYDHAYLCFDAWYEELLPKVGRPLHVEHSFDIPWFEYDNKHHFKVRLSGTIDYVNTDLVVFDWKTSGSEYERWKLDRWAVQPTVYSIALAEMGVTDFPVEFNYGVMIRGRSIGHERGATQLISVTRNESHAEWLKDQVRSIIDLWIAWDGGVLADWPKIDSGWHCSGSWCPVWDSCKGAHASGQLHLVAA